MLITPPHTRPVVASCLGLVMVLASLETSRAQTPAAMPLGAGIPVATIEPAAGGGTGPVARAEAPRLRLALFDAAGLPANVNARARHRVTEIFEQIAVAIEWYEPSSTSTGDQDAEPYYLKIILFDRAAAAMGHPADAMGVAFHTDLLPDAVWLFDPVIRRTLESWGSRRRPLSAEQLGRAYGRVIAHEVIHAVANDMRHSDTGVMAPTQSRGLLVQSSVAVDSGSERSFRAGLERIRRSVAQPGR